MLRAFADGRLFGVVSGESPAVVLALHGWGRSSGDFASVLDGMDAIALDLPGFGASPLPPQPWGAADYAGAVATVLDEMAAPVVVVGHSFGGRVAVHLAAARPEQVGGLVLTGVPLVRPAGMARPGPALLYRVARALHRRGMVPEARMEALRQRYGSADYRRATGVMRAVHVRAVNETYEEQLAHVSCPVELVWGDDDDAVPVSVAEAASRLLAEAHLHVVPGAGHHTPLTAPAALREAIDRRLAAGHR